MILTNAVRFINKAAMIMEEVLHRLEKKIKELINQRDCLKESNQQLQQGQFTLHREKEAVLARQEKAIAQIKTLIARLKAIEK